MIKVLKMPCNCTPPTKPAYKSKTNWLVNLPLLAMAVLTSLSGSVQALSDFIPPPIILWSTAILNFYYRNFDEPTVLTFKKQPKESPPLPLTNQKNGVIFSHDVQPSNLDYQKNAGGTASGGSNG